MTRVRPRVIWSPISQVAPAASVEIAQLVTEVYTNHDLLPPEWTPLQRREFLHREAARLSRQVAELAADMTERAVQDWISRTGDHPDYLTKIGLVNTATGQAQDLVLSQGLYELIPLPQDDSLEDSSAKLPDRSRVPWHQRWTRTYYRTEPTEDQEDLVAAVWPAPDFSALFRIKAEYLIAARAEDHQLLPADRYDPLADQLATLVYADLRADGLPTQPTREKP